MRRLSDKRAVLPLLLLLAPLVARGQPATEQAATEQAAPQCHLPERIAAAPCPHSAAPRGAAGDFDFYILSFSWSPAFCASGAGRRQLDPTQCRDNDFGWVVHGLWPQYAKSRAAAAGRRAPSWPQYCRPVAPVPEPVLRRHLCTLPDPQLMQCEWARHGSCSDFAGPVAYFSAIERLKARFTLPAPAGGSKAFIAEILKANQGLARDALRVVRRDGQIRELQLCLSRDLERTRSCRE
ncbi:MAG TPA: hypothetical protein VF194_00385 [Ferrovibrio sp.]|uniref:ribonuclease T2 family protein n=1 Tax=Ferrovibrio sp. TaxID=1917215 RepID=UPI002ED2EE8F